MIRLEESRNALVLGVERFAVVARYVCYFVMVSLFLLRLFPGELLDLAVVTALIVAHNVFSHWVLLSGRGEWFRGKTNFLIYLFETSLVVLFTGGDESPAWALYLFLLIGFSIYTPRFSRTLVAAGACCLSYLVVLFVEWRLAGLALAIGAIAARFVVMVVCGWLMGRVSELLTRLERGYLAQAQASVSSEAALRTILNSAPDPIVVFDDHEFVTEANEHACALVGLSREELLGHRIRAFVFDDGTLPTRIAALRSRGEAKGEQIVIDSHGEERHVEVTVRSRVWDDRRHFVAVMHDVTERKQLQEATRLANVNLAGLYDQLRQVNELREDCLKTVSQRIRSPLSAILGYVDLMLSGDLGEIAPEQRRALQTCRRSAMRLFRIMDEALRPREPEGPGTRVRVPAPSEDARPASRVEEDEEPGG